MTIVLDGIKLCCDKKPTGKKTKEVEIMSSPKRVRKQPSAKEKRRLISEQDNRCFYCGMMFGSCYTRDGINFLTTKIHYDHLVPFAYSQTNEHFVASCNICNMIKRDKMFDRLEDLVHYILNRIDEKKIDFI